MPTTIALIFLWVAIALIGDIFLKNAGGFSGAKFWCGILLYAFCSVPAILSFKRVEFGSVVILWMAVSLLVGLLISVFYYHEKFTLNTGLAAVLTLIAVYLVNTK